MLCVTTEQFQKCDTANQEIIFMQSSFIFLYIGFLNARSQLDMPFGIKEDDVWIQGDGKRKLIKT